MTEFVYGLAVVVALGVALLAACLWLVRERDGEIETAALEAVPLPVALRAVDPLPRDEPAPQPLAS